jgi:hypothetical protein
MLTYRFPQLITNLVEHLDILIGDNGREETS